MHCPARGDESVAFRAFNHLADILDIRRFGLSRRRQVFLAALLEPANEFETIPDGGNNSRQHDDFCKTETEHRPNLDGDTRPYKPTGYRPNRLQ